jgi:hypothetical protein
MEPLRRGGGRTRGSHLPILVAFWAYKGLEVDLLYRLQSRVFGDTAHWTVLVQKVLVDQLLYCPLLAIPATTLCYSGLRRGWRRLLDGRSLAGWYRREVIPLLVLNWMVWLPAVSLIYCLPLPLQLPMQNLVLCLWSLFLLFLQGTPSAAEQELHGLDARVGH